MRIMRDLNSMINGSIRVHCTSNKEEIKYNTILLARDLQDVEASN
jgi:hypothetical protein